MSTNHTIHFRAEYVRFRCAAQRHVFHDLLNFASYNSKKRLLPGQHAAMDMVEYVMKYVCIGIGILLLIVLFWFLCMLRRHRAVRCVCKKNREEKVKALNQALKPFGYRYCEKQDIIISTRNNWQRTMGYCRFYDESAVAANMVFDCEPVVFFYNGRKWLIEFWKGQYGISTGGEVGIYKAREEIRLPGIFSGTFYESVEDWELLPIEFALKKNGKILCERCALHWWLTAFLPGEYSRHESLSMEIKLTFPDCEMRNAFLEGLYRLGYEKHEVCVCNSTVRVSFTAPKSGQPKRCRFRVRLAESKNRRSCAFYRRFTGCFQTNLDKITYLICLYPKAYQFLLCAGRLSNKNRRLKKFTRKYRKARKTW